MYIRDIYTPNPTKEDDEYVETPCTGIGGNGFSLYLTLIHARSMEKDVELGWDRLK